MADFGFESGFIIVPRFGEPDPADHADIGNGWINTISGLGAAAVRSRA